MAGYASADSTDQDVVEQIRTMVRAGQSDQSISATLHVDAELVERVRVALSDDVRDRFAGSTGDQFVNWANYHIGLIKDLDEVAKDWKTQGTAFVGAVKLKAELYKRIVEKGEALGVISKSSDGAISIAEGTPDLEKMAHIASRLAEVNRFIAKEKRLGLQDLTMERPTGQEKKEEAPKPDRKPVKIKRAAVS